MSLIFHQFPTKQQTCAVENCLPSFLFWNLLYFPFFCSLVGGMLPLCHQNSKRVILGFNFLFFTVGLWVTAVMPIRTITLVLPWCEISTYRRLRSAIVGVIAFMPVDHRLKSSESLKSALEGKQSWLPLCHEALLCYHNDWHTRIPSETTWCLMFIVLWHVPDDN